MTKQLSVLMQKEMTRKEFLTTLGLGLATALGFGSLIRLLTGRQDTFHGGSTMLSGYGSGAYGGTRQ